MSRLSYQDFDIRIGQQERGARKRWPVEANSPEGDARGDFVLPIEPEERSRLLANTPWLERAEVERLGACLYDALFAPDIRALFLASFKSAKRNGQGLRLKLRISPGELALLPWELMRRTDINIALAQSEWTPIVRYIDQPNPPEPLAYDGKLKILLVSASPSDQDKLDIESEADSIVGALSPLGDRVEVMALHRARKIGFLRELRQGYHVLHFMLHGVFDEAAGEGRLMLENDAGRSDPLSAADLHQVVFDQPQTRLIVFNACETGRMDAAKIFSGLAGAVVQAGIPAVISMQYSITDEAAGHLSKELYLCLAEGYPVDQAMAMARTAIQVQAKGDNEWITPVLHMRARDGLLFQGTPSGIPHLGREADVQVQKAVAATTRRAAPQHGPASEMLLRFSPDAIQIECGGESARVQIPQAACAQETRLAAGLRSLPLGQDYLKRLGSRLFDLLFRGELKALYDGAVSRAGPAPLALRLVCDGSELAALPWEYLFHPDRQTYLCLGGARRPMRREIPGAPVEAALIERPLRILFVACRPLDMPFLDLEREWNWLDSALREFPAEEVQADLLKDPTPAEWIDRLSSSGYHVLHFAGYDSHAFSDFQQDEGIILLDEYGQRRYVVMDELLNLLQGCPSLRLALFNTCFTAHRLAPALVRAGIPAAIGMKGYVPDDVAIRFTKLFYPLLLRGGLRVDIALAETRRLLYMDMDRDSPGLWGFPTLYMAGG